MFCGQCGTNTKDDAVFCPNCGASLGNVNANNTSNEINEVNNTESYVSSTISNTSNNGQINQPIASIDEPMYANQNEPVNETNYNNQNGSMYNAPANGGMYQQPTVNPPKEKKPVNKKLLIGVIALIVVIIGCCIGGFIYFKKSKNNKKLESFKEILKTQIMQESLDVDGMYITFSSSNLKGVEITECSEDVENEYSFKASLSYEEEGITGSGIVVGKADYEPEANKVFIDELALGSDSDKFKLSINFDMDEIINQLKAEESLYLTSDSDYSKSITLKQDPNVTFTGEELTNEGNIREKTLKITLGGKYGVADITGDFTVICNYNSGKWELSRKYLADGQDVTAKITDVSDEDLLNALKSKIYNSRLIASTNEAGVLTIMPTAEDTEVELIKKGAISEGAKKIAVDLKLTVDNNFFKSVIEVTGNYIFENALDPEADLSYKVKEFSPKLTTDEAAKLIKEDVKVKIGDKHATIEELETVKIKGFAKPERFARGLVANGEIKVKGKTKKLEVVFKLEDKDNKYYWEVSSATVK